MKSQGKASVVHVKFLKSEIGKKKDYDEVGINWKFLGHEKKGCELSRLLTQIVFLKRYEKNKYTKRKVLAS